VQGTYSTTVRQRIPTSPACKTIWHMKHASDGSLSSLFDNTMSYKITSLVEMVHHDLALSLVRFRARPMCHGGFIVKQANLNV
jgi:hypothetical protein